MKAALQRRISALVLDARAIDADLRTLRDEAPGSNPRALARALQKHAETASRAAQRMADRLEKERGI